MSTWTLMLFYVCICWRSAVHNSVLSYLLLKSVTKKMPLTRGPVRSSSMRGVLCCFLPRYIDAVLAKHPTKKCKAENGWIFSREKSKMKLWHSFHGNPRKLTVRLNIVFLTGHVGSSYRYVHNFLFLNEARFWTAFFVRKTGGVPRNENGGVGRSRWYLWDLPISTILAVCTLHLLLLYRYMIGKDILSEDYLHEDSGRRWLV